MPVPRTIPCRDRALVLPDDGTLLLMGIVNVTPDSFSDGGRHDTTAAALAYARALLAEGATILDIGGQSTRPGYVEVSHDEEIARTIPVIRELVATTDAIVSIDTYQPVVARAALEAGAHILNDIHGLQGPGGSALAELAAATGAAVVVMHNDPTLRDLPPDTDPLPHLINWLKTSLAIAARAGLPRERLILDPGIGFGKTHPQNLTILSRLDELHDLGQPILLGASRKSFIAHVLDGIPPAERLEGTLAATTAATLQGVQLHRVHDVAANLRAARLAAALRRAR